HHRDAGARAVLGHRTRRHVQVDAASTEFGRVQIQLCGVRAQVGERDLGRLLHHVTELTGERQPWLTIHRGRLDEENVAAGAGDRETRGDAGHGGSLGGLADVPRPAKVADQVVNADVYGTGALRRLNGNLAQDAREGPLELAYAGLPSVLGRDGRDRLVVDAHLVGGHAGPLQLPWPEVVAGDGDLLRLGVAVQGDDLHPVQQRAWDGVDDVRGGEEEHVGQVQVHLQVVVP